MTNNLKHTVLVFLTSLLLAIAANGAEVTRVDTGGTLVWVGGFPIQEWKINDSLCMYQGDGVVACGAITAMTTDKVAVKLSERKRQLVAGEMVSLRKNLRSPATTASVSEQIEDSSKQALADASVGLTAGHNYFYPMAHFQFAVSRSLSFGIMPVFASYSQSPASVSFYGAFATVTYYHTHYAFKGVNFEGGLGYFNIKATSGLAEQSTNPISMKMSVGWRGRALWGAPLDLGVAAGAQYVFLDTAPLDITFKKLLPMLSVFIAYSF